MSALAMAVALAVALAAPAKPVPAGCYKRPLEQGSGSVLVCKGGVL